MKPKTLLLLGIAIFCGLVAAYMTSRLIQEHKEVATVWTANQRIAPGTVVKDPREFFASKEILKLEVPLHGVSGDTNLEQRIVCRPLEEGSILVQDDLLSPGEEYLVGELVRLQDRLDLPASAKANIYSMVQRNRETRAEHRWLRRSAALALAVMLVVLPLLAAILLFGKDHGIVWKFLFWNITIRGERYQRPAEPGSLLSGPVAWFRVGLGAAIIVLGTYWTKHIHAFMVNASGDSLETIDVQYVWIGLSGIFSLSIFLGGVSAGAATTNGLKQGLVTGIVAAVILSPLCVTRGNADLLMFLISSIIFLAPLSGWFGSAHIRRIALALRQANDALLQELRQANVGDGKGEDGSNG